MQFAGTIGDNQTFTFTYNISTSSFNFSPLDDNMSSPGLGASDAVLATFQETKIKVCGGFFGGEEFGALETPLKSLSVLCPVACGCTEKRLNSHGRMLSNCPSSCQKEQIKS